jgi:hypothetical protein
VAYVTLDANSNITGMYFMPQPQLPGYAVIEDTDPRIAVFEASIVPPTTYTFLQFMGLFTSAEQTAIFASNDTQTKIFITMAAGAGGLQLANAELVSGVNYLATLTTATPPGPALITASRAAQILAGTAPP